MGTLELVFLFLTGAGLIAGIHHQILANKTYNPRLKREYKLISRVALIAATLSALLYGLLKLS